jgi:hypothetical protein
MKPNCILAQISLQPSTKCCSLAGAGGKAGAKSHKAKAKHKRVLVVVASKAVDVGVELVLDYGRNQKLEHRNVYIELGSSGTLAYACRDVRFCARLEFEEPVKGGRMKQVSRTYTGGRFVSIKAAPDTAEEGSGEDDEPTETLGIFFNHPKDGKFIQEYVTTRGSLSRRLVGVGVGVG